MTFNWVFYCQYNGLCNLGINSKKKAILHYTRVGKYKGLPYNQTMLHPNNAIYSEFDSLLKSIKKYDCPCKKSLNNEPFNKLWKFLHDLSYKYENIPDTNSLLQQIMSNIRNIACDECRNHYIAYYDSQDIAKTLEDTDGCILYFFNLHNEINERTNKKVLTREECDALYNKST